MTNYYEYEHPIINKFLAASGRYDTHDINDNGVDKGLVIRKHEPQGKKFPTLESWYRVVNDYEFQARCPIILKNSHKNKHFTFACHLKSCPFKILVSYCGEGIDGYTGHEHLDTDNVSTVTDSHQNMGINTSSNNSNEPHKENHNNGDGVVDEGLLALNSVKDEDDNKKDSSESTNTSKAYSEIPDVEDPVTAAFAAVVVAAVDSSNNNNNNNHVPQEAHQNVHNKNRNDVKVTLEDHSDKQLDENSIKDNQYPNSLITYDQRDIHVGPFVVTKIEPYHSHPLESNLTLSKFVLTKIPRILQNDLNFDELLESLCNQNNNTISKFRVSQYVEDSGIKDILKQRYGLTEDDLDKKLVSSISRRVTTYKARFVLKKKKKGEYGKPYPGLNPPPHINITTSHDHLNIRNTTPASLAASITKTETKFTNEDEVDHDSTPSNEDRDTTTRSEISDQYVESGNKIKYTDHQGKEADVSTLQATAQAAINEVSHMKRSIANYIAQQDDNDHLANYQDSLRKRQHTQAKHIDDSNIQTNHNIKMDMTPKDNTDHMSKNDVVKLNMVPLMPDDSVLSSLDDNDRLPNEVAEQLRLLSSHYKDIESTHTGVSIRGDNNIHSGNQNDTDDDAMERAIMNLRDATESNHGEDMDIESDIHSSPSHHKDEISDDNIQPELRDQ